VTSPEPESAKPTVLVTGATGYIGGRLVPGLEAAGFVYDASTLGSGARLIAGLKNPSVVTDPAAM
jgi:nucleoside-diphosphate-sugar epimerase